MAIAQTFNIKNLPSNIPGIFLTYVGLFFKSKDPNLGVSLAVTEVQNGMPNSKRILARSHLRPEYVTVSDDGTAETYFVLESPVFLLTNTEYAFFIQPDGNSPEYNIWSGETGGFDITTGEQVFSNPYSGIMFVSGNKRGWTAIQKEDIKFNLYRANFSAASGHAVLKNENDEALLIDGFTRANNSVSITVGDVVYTVADTANTADINSIVSNTIVTGVSGRVQYILEEEGEIYLDSSTANSSSYFSNTVNPLIAVYNITETGNSALVTNTTLVAYGTVQEVRDLVYHAVVPKFSTMSPARTNIEYEFKGTSTSDDFDSTAVFVEKDKTYEYKDRERHLVSRSNEVSRLSSAKTSEYKLNFFSGSQYISPIINLGQKSSLYVENLINNDVTNEHTKNGNALSKYVSKKVVLADGQEAEDLKVYLTAYRPFETDIKVYAKFWNNEDPDPFDEKVWTELEYENNSELVYSTDSEDDYKEYVFNVPSSNSVAYGAFANVSSETASVLTGTVSITNNSVVLTGTGTSFDTEVNIGDLIRIDSSDYFAIRTVVNIANATHMTVDLGLQESNSASVAYVFEADSGNEGIVEYTSPSDSRFVGYKEFAVKIVLLSSNPVRIPKVDDIRAIALQI